MKNQRKLAIKNLKGSEEKMRVSWMLKNMQENRLLNIFLKAIT